MFLHFQCSTFMQDVVLGYVDCFVTDAIMIKISGSRTKQLFLFVKNLKLNKRIVCIFTSVILNILKLYKDTCE